MNRIRYQTFCDLCAAIPFITMKKFKFITIWSEKSKENGISNIPTNFLTQFVLCSFRPMTFLLRLDSVRSSNCTPRKVAI